MRFQNVLILFLLALLIGAGSGLGVFLSMTKTKSRTVEEQATVLLEKVRTVARMVTVEGQFSEIVNYKNYWAYDWGPLRKKALVRVQAKVSVGYDLSEIQLEAVPEDKRLVMTWDPTPKILSVEHEMDYYDLTEGTFNNFTEADYNRINGLAIDQIRNKALNSSLFEAADRQARDILDMIGVLVDGMGWQFVVRENQYALTE